METKGRAVARRHIFIAGDTYQLMQAASWARRNNTDVHVYYTSGDVPEGIRGRVHISRIPSWLVYAKPSPAQPFTESMAAFYRDMSSDDVELHVFGYTDMYFARGRLDIHLHEAGESSYIPNTFGSVGEDDPFTVARLHLTEDLGLDSSRVGVAPVDREAAAEVLGTPNLPDPPERTVLYVHNEPDTVRYTPEEVDAVHTMVGDLLRDMKAAGYTVWVKDHHKRAGRCDLPAADLVVPCPVELLDTSLFEHVVSVRSKCVCGLDNGFNGVTREAVTKCTKGFLHAYARGVAKIRRHLGLPDMQDGVE